MSADVRPVWLTKEQATAYGTIMRMRWDASPHDPLEVAVQAHVDYWKDGDRGREEKELAEAVLRALGMPS